jgi:hypothetical protein
MPLQCGSSSLRRVGITPIRKGPHSLHSLDSTTGCDEGMTQSSMQQDNAHGTHHRNSSFAASAISGPRKASEKPPIAIPFGMFDVGISSGINPLSLAHSSPPPPSPFQASSHLSRASQFPSLSFTTIRSSHHTGNLPPETCSLVSHPSCAPHEKPGWCPAPWDATLVCASAPHCLSRPLYAGCCYSCS